MGCVCGKLRMDARRAAKVIAAPMMPRRATQQTPQFVQTLRERGVLGAWLCRSACQGRGTIGCASLRALHPRTPRSHSRFMMLDALVFKLGQNLVGALGDELLRDRKSTRLNSSHSQI